MRVHKNRLALQRQLSIISSQLPAAYDELRPRFATLGGESPSVPPLSEAQRRASLSRRAISLDCLRDSQQNRQIPVGRRKGRPDPHGSAETRYLGGKKMPRFRSSSPGIFRSSCSSGSRESSAPALHASCACTAARLARFGCCWRRGQARLGSRLSPATGMPAPDASSNSPTPRAHAAHGLRPRMC